MIRPRQAVDNLDSYAAPQEGRARKIRLDFNENTVGFPESCPGMLPELLTTYPEYDHFLEKLSHVWQIPKERLMLTNGSDEALFLIPFTFIEPNQDKALISSPTFSMIPHYLRLCQANIVHVPVTESLAFDIPAIEAQLKQTVKLAVFASPDNPTGATLPPETVASWCQTYPETLFVIDEAYSEYAGQTVLPLIDRFENLLVTRTFSKAWGLAGARLGVILGHPSLIRYLMCTRSPYSVNALSLVMAEPLLERMDDVYREAALTMQRKSWSISQIERRGYQVVAGAANFFLLKMGIDAQAFCDFCEARNVLIRNRSSVPGMWGMIRISVGTDAEMQALLDCLDAFKDSRALIFDLDDTLVDTSQSYDATIVALVEQYSGQPLSREELKSLRAEGGFNDDWDATVVLLQRRGIAVTRDEIEQQGKVLYLQCAKSVETLFIEPSILVGLRQRYRLLVATGRPRDEYLPVWHDRLTGHFENVYCQDDFHGIRRKPAPDILLSAMRDAGVSGGLYVGNAVDDMRAALEAGLIPVGVATTQDKTTLEQAGAACVMESMHELRKVFLL